MIKLFIKLALAALLANGAYRIGSEYLTYIKFRDGVRDAAMFKARTDEELQQRIFALASQYEVPLAEDAISIQRDERRVTVQGKYRKPIEVVPNYFYAWPFSWSIDAVVSTTVPLIPSKQ